MEATGVCTVLHVHAAVACTKPLPLLWCCVVPCPAPLESIPGTPSIKGNVLQKVTAVFVLMMVLALFGSCIIQCVVA